VGEHIYQDAGSRVLHQIDEADFVTPEKAAAALNPLLDAESAAQAEPGKLPRGPWANSTECPSGS
jgi:hypothetical protein